MPTKLSALPTVTSVGTADVMLVDQSATSKQATVAQVAAAMLASPALTGTPTAPTAAVDTNTTQLSTTAFVLAQAASATPLIDGTAAVGTSTRYARADHVHPTDTTRAPLASPTFTGTPAAPTATVGTNTTQIATTAFVLANAGSGAVSSVFGRTGVVVATTADYTVSQVTGAAPLASPALTGTPTAPTAAVDTSTTQVATTAFVVAQAASATPIIDGTAAVGTSTRYARADHVHPTDTTRAPLASPTFTGTATIPTAAIATHYGTITSDTDAATVTFDLSASDWHKVTLGGNRTLAVSNATVGQQFSIRLTQAASGGPYVPTWFAGITWMTSTFTQPTPPTTAGGIMTCTFKCIAANTYDGFWCGNSAT